MFCDLCLSTYVIYSVLCGLYNSSTINGQIVTVPLKW